MSKNRRSSFRPKMDHLEIPEKANWVLNIVLVGFILIIVRIWHLSVVQYDEKLEESRRPRRKVVMEPARRGTIRDRFNQPLAINKIQYQATVVYSHLREVPAITWKTDTLTGQRVKHYSRKEYITRLSQTLGDILELDPTRIEDLIHSKASYYFNIPFVLKEELTEAEYYRLKMMEKDWIGIHVRALPRRDYPRGQVGAEIIGYMGAINREEYESVIHEMKALDEYIEREGENVDVPKGVESIAQARNRLKDLQERAYTINDYVGKMGIEGMFEEDLRGFQGKRSFYSDSRGNFLKDLPGTREPLSGQRLLLTISADLQEFTEQLLAQNEKIREVRMTTIVDSVKHTFTTAKHPWIKGGAIVAMDPHTGEVLALASYPRFNPNDFIASGDPEINKEKKSNIGRWFESEQYLGEVWDQKRPLEREVYDNKQQRFEDEKVLLSWNTYVDKVLGEESQVFIALEKLDTIQKANDIQTQIEKLQDLTKENNLYILLNALYKEDGHIPYKQNQSTKERKNIEAFYKEHPAEINSIKAKLDPIFNLLPLNYDKILLVDLCRIAVPSDRFTPPLIENVGHVKLSDYHDTSAAIVQITEVLRGMAKDLFHQIDFNEWRNENEKAFLKQKRAEEKENHRYPKPYLDYLDAEETKMFNLFWEKNSWNLIYAFLKGVKPQDENATGPSNYYEHLMTWHRELNEGAHQAVSWKESYAILEESLIGLDEENALSYLKTLRGYKELNRPLYGKYRHLRSNNGEQLEKHLASAFYPVYGFGFARSQAFRQAAVQGSIFKLVTAYQVLIQDYQKLAKTKKEITIRDLNPLEMEDQVFKQGNNWYVGYHADGKPIPQIYRGGRLPRSHSRHLGKMDIIRAFETSSNPYFALLASDCLDNPEDLSKAAEAFCFGAKTGIDLPYEIKGRIPKNLDKDRNELYSFAIGQGTFIVTPLQTAVMLSAIANGGKVIIPKIVGLTAGRSPHRDEEMNSCAPCFPYQDQLASVGIDFPLFMTSDSSEEQNLIYRVPTEIKRTLFMPEIVRKILLMGMKRVVTKTQEESLPSLTRLYREHPHMISDYLAMGTELAGKTSTSESMEMIDLDHDKGTNLYTHAWFGGISFTKDNKDNKDTYVFHDEFGNPELVVVVYLRFGGYGKEAAPVAAQVIKKWREIKANSK